MKHAVIACLLIATAATAQTDRTFLKSKLAAERHLPFSSGVLVSDTLYIAGTAAGPEKLAAGLSVQDEARDIMEQVKQVVEQAGMTMDDVVFMQAFCTDLSLYDAFNSVYRTYYHDNFPARTFVSVPKLLFGARLEVNGIAVSRAKQRKK